MDSYCHNISDYAFGDAKSSLLSLQFLQEMDEDPQDGAKINHSHAVRNDSRSLGQINLQGHSSQINNQSQIVDHPSSQKQQPQAQSRTQLENFDDKCSLSQAQSLPADLPMKPSYSELIQTLDHLDQSDISKKFSKRESLEVQGEALERDCHQQLNMLKQLEEKALAQIQESEQAEQVKQNFQLLFQRVYGIIQEIQQRNEKSQLIKSQFNSTVKLSSKKELGFNPRVIELSVGKQNDNLKKKKFCSNLLTQFNFDNGACDEGPGIVNQVKTQENWWIQTPIPSTTRAKPATLLSLSKQYPTIVSPKAHLNTARSARSDRSMKSKGITLVSAQKKMQSEVEGRKPVKITLMQKKMVPCPKKKVDLTLQIAPVKAEKKTSSFNPNSFFSSRRVSTRIV